MGKSSDFSGGGLRRLQHWAGQVEFTGIPQRRLFFSRYCTGYVTGNPIPSSLEMYGTTIRLYCVTMRFFLPYYGVFAIVAHMRTLAIVLIIGSALPSIADPRDYNAAIRTLVAVESGGVSKVGDGHRAHGILQIWKIRVSECNRIVGHKEWSYTDRDDQYESARMAVAFLRHEAADHPQDTTARWLERWRNPNDNTPVPYWYHRKIVAALGVKP